PSIGSTLPNVVKPEFDLPVQKPGQLPDTYRLRDLERRSEMAERFGGTRDSEQAVENSLAWLARHQSTAGFWDADRYGAGRGPESDVAGLNLSTDRKKVRQESGIQADTGVTALALLAFLAAGYTNEEGQYASNVDRAIDWLIDQQRSDGYLGGAATYFAANYCHGMATYALAEALGMQSDPKSALRLRAAVQKGVNYTVGMQLSADGGWRYNRNSSEGDMSIFGWQLMALKSAEIAGLPIPAEASERMIHFLQLRSQGTDKGLASYRTGEAPSPAMTAEALFCKQILGIRRSNPQSIQAVGYLLQQPPKLSEWNLYYWYYGTLAMYQFGGAEWETWNRSMRKVLTETQRTEGDNAGSWDPVGPWGPYGGRVYSTAMATLCLEVYYRFLPLYEHGGRFDE
ncbi:MAG TPA: prenyltransferase/squalene oxidase repeat-containing protein, partial [Planctomycetaceae bacterium]|nr:prenyltransferase/squalene oxidase repeat-containing protein [Planctomycetaceae bacterium]